MIRPPDTLTLATVQSYVHSDNVYENKVNKKGSDGWVGIFGVAYIPYSTLRWTPRVLFQQSFVRFGSEGAGDYDSQVLGFVSSLDLSADQAWSWHAGFTLSRYYGEIGNGHEFYKYYSIDNSISWHRALDARQRIQFFGACWLSWRHADPDYLSRVETALNFGLAIYPATQFAVSIYVRPALFIYPIDSSVDHDRRDFNMNAGLAVSWTPLRQFSIGAGFHWTGDYSNSDLRGYEEFLPGAALTLSFGF